RRRRARARRTLAESAPIARPPLANARRWPLLRRASRRTDSVAIPRPTWGASGRRVAARRHRRVTARAPARTLTERAPIARPLLAGTRHRPQRRQREPQHGLGRRAAPHVGPHPLDR